MKFTIKRGVPGHRVPDLLPRSHRGKTPTLDSNRPYTVVLFPHTNKDVVRSPLAEKALERVPPEDDLVACGGTFTAEARALLLARAATLIPLGEFHWTDSSYPEHRDWMGTHRGRAAWLAGDTGLFPLHDPKWKTLHGGYRVPYDPSDALERLEKGQDSWDELWNELHHQGDVGEASYAAVPHLVRIGRTLPARDFNLYSLVSVIEIERHEPRNPPMPEWCHAAYEAALVDLTALAIEDLRVLDDPSTLRSILGFIALARGHRKLGTLLTVLDDSEIDEVLSNYR